jgi:3-oxoacyl-[acyl-carrier-protein] synthase I
LYCYAATINALEDSNILIKDVSNPRIGMFTASSGSPKNLYHNIHRMVTSGISRCSPYGMISSISGTLTFNLTSIFKIKGASCCFVSACASSGHAIGHAYNSISEGDQDLIIVTSGEDGDLSTILPFAGMRALSSSTITDDSSKPFDSKRGGFVGSGGGVTIILEELKHAISRKASIYGEILG